MTKYNNIQIYEEPIFACTDDKGNWELDEGGQVIKYYKIGGVDITIDFDKNNCEILMTYERRQNVFNTLSVKTSFWRGL